MLLVIILDGDEHNLGKLSAINSQVDDDWSNLDNTELGSGGKAEETRSKSSLSFFFLSGLRVGLPLWSWLDWKVNCLLLVVLWTWADTSGNSGLWDVVDDGGGRAEDGDDVTNEWLAIVVVVVIDDDDDDDDNSSLRFFLIDFVDDRIESG